MRLAGDDEAALIGDDHQLGPVPDLRVVKVSFPRPITQGSLHDRDMHAGQHHVPLANIACP
jgi:hypothetical protein